MIVLAPGVAAILVAGVALCVLADARRWSQAGTPVTFRLGSFSIETPESWAVGCLLLFVFFVPLYAVARRES